MKASSEMSVSELLEADTEASNKLDSTHYYTRAAKAEILAGRREIRAELTRRHEMSRQSDCPTTDAELDAISALLHI